MDFQYKIYEAKGEKMRKQAIDLLKKQPMPLHFHMEISGEKEGSVILIHGVLHIEEYTCEDVVLQIRGGRIRIFGNGFSLSVFENRCVEIRGKLSEVVYIYDRT